MPLRFAAAFLILLSGVTLVRAQQEQDAPQVTFRAGVNAVRVDVIVTDKRGNPITGLTRDDFELLEDGKPQVIEQFRLVDVAAASSDAPPAAELRTRDDELLDAEREDVRVFALLLDDYHVPQTRSIAVRDALADFIRTHVRPHDLLAVMYPLTSVRTLTFTRDHESVLRAVRAFTGRKGDYAPRNAIEEQHWRNLPAIERIRADVVAGALSALSIRLGSLREGRKSVILVSDGFGANYQTLRDVQRDANRNNVSIYPFDPCGLMAPGGFNPNGGMDCSVSRLRRDTLLTIATETNGRAILNRNSLVEGLAQIARDASYYYLLGYNSSHGASDGKFHDIRVRVKVPGADVRARKGYWTLGEVEAARAATSRPIVLTPVQRALASIDLAADAKRYVRTWVGTDRAEAGTRVTLAWDLLPRRDLQEWEQPGRLVIEAEDAGGVPLFEGNGTIAPGAQTVAFIAPPGRLELRLGVESSAGGETIDREIVAIEVPDLAQPQTALATPRVFAARTAPEFRALAGDPGAAPTPRREFSRMERLLIRFDVYGTAAGGPEVSASLVNRSSSRLAALPVSAAESGGTHQLVLPLGGLAPGEYVVEILAKAGDTSATALVPLRVGQ